MASLATRPPGEARGTAPLGSLLLLLLSPGWGQPWWAQAGETGQEAALPDPVLANASSFASLPPGLLLGFTCAEVFGLSTERVQELAVAVGRKNVTLRVDQLRCLARGLSAHGVPEDLDAFPPDLLLFLDPAGLSGPQACARFFSCVSAASVDLLPRAAPERQRLLAAALACRGVRGSRVSAADVQALGGLACDLPGRFVADSPAALLPRLAGCPGPLDQDQQEAARAALQGGGPPYGSPSTWTVSTLDALQGLLPVLGPDTIRSIPKGVMTLWLQRTYGSPSWRRPELTLVLPRFRRDAENMTCPPGREARMVDENLVLYQDWELEACVDGALLAAQMDRVNANPFTYQQLDIFKRKLDKVYQDGYPESLIQQLGCFFLRMSPQDVHKWNVTSLHTVHTLLRVSRGRKVDAQVAALIARYVSGGGRLHRDTLDALAGFRPTYLCSFSPEQLGTVPPSILWAVEPQDLDTCGPRQLGVLYPKARLAFRNVSGAVYLLKIQSFLGGASTEDLRALSQRNVSMDVATFRKLPKEAVVGLTVLEVQRLLGPHVRGLTAEQRRSPVWDWILRQRQDDLDAMGLGLQGGVPNGYLVLDLGGRRRQAEMDRPEPRSLPGALSGGRRLLGPGPVLSATLTLPLVLGRH